MGQFLDAFISYGRADSKAFAIALYEQLTQQGLQIWLDQSDIPLGVDFQNQIDDGIKRSDNFLFIIAPHSINSPYCRKEIELALQCNKRIIPILQVEQITRQTWQQRYPGGTDAEWQQYQAAGLHSSFANMHPAIGKINWLYWRDGIDDPEKALAGLVEVMHRHQEYVRQHTNLLYQAQVWEQYHRQPQHLLIGKERQEAEKWLKTRFETEQAPCIPTDLHCEFISDSSKNAHNWMTHVFLSHAEVDKAFAQKIRLRLMREGFTVWTNHTDIHTGSDFQQAINQGIEAADNVIYLVSPAAVQSTYCQQELEYALLLKKRIIPILAEATTAAQLPTALRTLQYIDITDNLVAADFEHDASNMLRILQQDAVYYESHKILLVKALKWERQKRNTSLLLRGYNLRHAEAWLKLANQHSQHGAIAVQTEFIEASLAQPPDASLDVFVSYSRVDSDFARKLNDALQIQGKTTWFDQESIAAGSDFRQEIFRGIESSNHFLFIISPSSVTSPYCTDEVEYAERLNKRIITVLHHPVDTKELHLALASVQWVDFNQHNADFYANFSELVRLLGTDQAYLQQHTRLLLRSLEWERLNYDSSFLLRGTELLEAEQWLQSAAGQAPAVTELQIRFIRTSRRSPLRQASRPTVVTTSLVALIAMAFLRAAGVLQPLELPAFDHLTRLRSPEPPDQRLLIVDITEDDITAMEDEVGKGVLKDPSLNRLLQWLERYQPRVIGLDLYRNFHVDRTLPELAQRLQKTDQLIGVCKIPEIGETAQVTNAGVAPPAELPLERIGFSDVWFDHDQVIRRQAIVAFPPANTRCPVNQSLGFLLARRYLEQEPGRNITFQLPTAPTDPIRLGDVALPDLGQRFLGGYGFQSDIDISDYKLLINFRAPTGDPEKIAERITLGQIWRNQVPDDVLNSLKDRLVLIGITSQVSVKDMVAIPDKQIPGVILQAQIASQVISTVLDKRLMWRVLPIWVDLLWMGLWTAIGGVVVYRCRSFNQIGLASVIALVSLYGMCWAGLMIGGIWLPLIPPIFSFVISIGGVLYITNSLSPQTGLLFKKRVQIPPR